MGGLNEHAPIVSEAIANASNAREIINARRKLARVRRPYERRAMEQRPEKVLTCSLNHARESLGEIMSRVPPDLIRPLPAKKRKKAGQSQAGGEPDRNEKGSMADADEDGDIDVIDLPSLMAGQATYSPFEAVAYIHNIMESNPGKPYVRAYKEKLVEEKVVPIKLDYLAKLVKQCRWLEGANPPPSWNWRGPRDKPRVLAEFMSMRRGQAEWTVDDSLRALVAGAADGADAEEMTTSEAEDALRHTIRFWTHDPPLCVRRVFRGFAILKARTHEVGAIRQIMRGGWCLSYS